MKTFISLGTIAILPILASTILYKIFNHEKVKLSPLAKQIIAGLIFGFIAILGTEYGVPIDGAIINARDAAPICAGLIFGPISGVMAGMIGGIERWLCVYWGGGYYTRLACSISTCLAGIISALLRKYLYDDKTPTWDHAGIIAMTVEVFHMLMIFVTNISDVRRAFTFVRACTVPMVSVNMIAVMLAVFVINRFENRHILEINPKKLTINVQFQTILIIVTLLAFGSMSILDNYLQQQISDEDTELLLRQGISDAMKDVEDRCDDALLHTNRLVAEIIDASDDYDLQEMKDDYNVAEIHVIDENGIIVASTEESYIGFDMSSGSDQSAEFMVLLEPDGPSELVQAYMPISINNDVSMKYSGVRINNGFVQVAYDGNQIESEISSTLLNVARNRRIGEGGVLLIVDQNNQLVSSTDGFFNDNTKHEFSFDENGDQEYTVYECTIDGEENYYMFTNAESYSVVGILPKSEAGFSKTLSAYLNGFAQSILFGSLFVVISMIIKVLIADNVKQINYSLTDITGGELDTVVDVKTNLEFTSLSDGINTTVDALKNYIHEANTRIDSELKYAKEIQESSLPAAFPAFPDYVKQFDIYALMDPAKEVGGDFYDFYIIDKDTLVFTVADVSGKGIPASLFMMRAKTTIKTYAEGGLAVADILTNANFQLCEGNDADMFVTAWIGFLNLKTGELKYSNAGHNRPLLRKANGNFEYLNGPAGFVLGGMEGIVYKEQSLVMEPGDEIFIYTDGVVEATNDKKQLYSDDRLHAVINIHKDEDVQNLCLSIRKDVDIFYDGSEQFDDITELCVKFIDYLKD